TCALPISCTGSMVKSYSAAGVLSFGGGVVSVSASVCAAQPHRARASSRAGNTVCFITVTSYYNIFTVQGTAASRVFFRIVAKAVRMRASWPDAHLQGPKRPQKSPSASLSFAAFDLCRLLATLVRPCHQIDCTGNDGKGWSPKTNPR